MGSDYGFSLISTDADSQKGNPYKSIPVEWRGSEAWQSTPRTPVFPSKFKEPNKKSTLEKNTAVSFDMAVGTGDLGSIYGDDLVITDLNGTSSTGSGNSTGGAGGELLNGMDWARWAPVAVGGVLIAFLLYQYTKGAK
jgi:hypothetical protein